MVDAVNLAAVSKVGREGRQRAKFIPDPRIRAKAGAAVMAAPPSVSLASATQLPGGSIKHNPEELRYSHGRTFQPSFTQWVTSQGSGDHELRVRKSHGFNGDMTPTAANPVAGDQLLSGEFDLFVSGASGSIEFEVRRNGSFYRLWVDEQPTTAYPTRLTTPNDNTSRFITYTGLTPGWHRIQFDMEFLAGLRSVRHLVGDTLTRSSFASKGRLMCVGDSIWQAGTALMGDAAPPHSQQYYAGGFTVNLGYRLGIQDVLTGYAQGGTGLCKTSGTGSVPFIDRVADDVVPAAPDALLVGCSSNDAGFTADQVRDALIAYVAAVRSALPDCQIIAVGPLAVPPPPAYGGAQFTAVVQGFLAGVAALGLDYVDTAGCFTGSAVAGGADQGNGNADLYKSAWPADVGSPHPNQAGHDHIAEFLAPKVARLLQIDMSVQPSVVGAVTPYGKWDS